MLVSKFVQRNTFVNFGKIYTGFLRLEMKSFNAAMVILILNFFAQQAAVASVVQRLLHIKQHTDADGDYLVNILENFAIKKSDISLGRTKTEPQEGEYCTYIRQVDRNSPLNE